MTNSQDDASTSFEVDRHTDDQPPREDLIDPEDIGTGDRDPFEDADEEPELGDAELLPDSEDLPESQGDDIVEADRLAEDAAARPPLSDEQPGEDR
jgi:hypothetical protein